MSQVIFCRTKRVRVQSETGGSACTVFARYDAHTACPELPGFASRQLQHSGLCAACPPARHHHRKADLVRLVESLAGDSVLRFGAHRVDRFRARLRPLHAPLGHAVTLALHACNAKINLVARAPLQSGILPVFACNVGLSPPIFSKNASVISAVDSSIDRMMPNRNHTTDLPHRPIFVGRARATRRVLSALPLHATERGAP